MEKYTQQIQNIYVIHDLNNKIITKKLNYSYSFNVETIEINKLSNKITKFSNNYFLCIANENVVLSIPFDLKRALQALESFYGYAFYFDLDITYFKNIPCIHILDSINKQEKLYAWQFYVKNDNYDFLSEIALFRKSDVINLCSSINPQEIHDGWYFFDKQHVNKKKIGLFFANTYRSLLTS